LALCFILLARAENANAGIAPLSAAVELASFVRRNDAAR
jgi:hypothetical protein